MAVWKSSPNGKSEPVSRQNNSLFGNLNGSELTFVSCQVQSIGGLGGSQAEEHYKVCQFRTQLELLDHIFFMWQKNVSFCQLSTCLALSFVIRAAPWIWFKSAPTHSDLGRIGGAGKSEWCCHSWAECWPCHGLPPFFLLLSLSAFPSDDISSSSSVSFF